MMTYLKELKKNKFLRKHDQIYARYIKRSLDLFFSIFLLIFTCPILIVLSILVLATMGFPIFFAQERPGLEEKKFLLLKFRTMNFSSTDFISHANDTFRTTSVGSFLRRFSLDELPQLINIFLGHMSFVGPRPLLIEYLDLYSEAQRRRHKVRPGLTGWSQVNGRNQVKWKKRFEDDVWYVDNLSFGLDIKIITITFLKVLMGNDVNSSNKVTMEKFTGGNDK